MLMFTQEEEKSSGTATPEATGVDATPDSDVVEERRRVCDDNSAELTEPTADKRAATNDVDAKEAVPRKKPMMNFVKAADS